MKYRLTKFSLLALIPMLNLFGSTQASTSTQLCDAQNNYIHESLDGSKTQNICEDYKGKVLLIVNTASKCGFTYQYDGLEKIYDEYKDSGFYVLGFPSADFGGQEYAESSQIQSFCKNTYAIEFPMFKKSIVSGKNATPLFKRLAEITVSPKWNFHKYLVDRDGRVVDYYFSTTKPESDKVRRKIESLL